MLVEELLFDFYVIPEFPFLSLLVLAASIAVLLLYLHFVLPD
ncbi:PEFG-CTERM sorting domain-containing protein [Roseivirga sp. BDSF3-8]